MLQEIYDLEPPFRSPGAGKDLNYVSFYLG